MRSKLKVLSYERRGAKRYPIALEIAYWVAKPGEEFLIGKGRTVDISSSGILFTTDDTLPTGSEVTMEISWPIPLDGNCPLKLTMQGRVVRWGNNQAAVEVSRCEFRTRKKAAIA